MHRWIPGILVTTLLAAVFALFVWMSRPRVSSIPFRELTSTDVENRVTAGVHPQPVCDR